MGPLPHLHPPRLHARTAEEGLRLADVVRQVPQVVEVQFEPRERLPSTQQSVRNATIQSGYQAMDPTYCPSGQARKHGSYMQSAASNGQRRIAEIDNGMRSEMSSRAPGPRSRAPGGRRQSQRRSVR